MPAPMRAMLLAGAGGGAFEWTIWSRVLAAQGIAVTAPEPGQGTPEAPAGVGDQLAELQPALAGLRAGDLLVGASFGGLLALLLAADAPAPLRLELLNPYPPAGVADGWRSAQALRPPWLRWSTLPDLRRSAEHAEDLDPAAVHWLHRHWRDASGQALNEARAGIPVARERLAQHRIRVVVGEADQDIPAAVGIELAAWLGAGLIRLPGASHLAPLAAPVAAMLARQAGDAA